MVLVDLFTDGAAKGNPGPGGYGAILRSGASEKELSGGFFHTTNNRMELMAVIVGLEALNASCAVRVVSDSKYVVDAFNKRWIEGWKRRGWAKVKNPDLWKRLLKAMEGHKVHYEWVRGHSNHPENERCDVLAVAASLNPIEEDRGYVVD